MQTLLKQDFFLALISDNFFSEMAGNIVINFENIMFCVTFPLDALIRNSRPTIKVV